MARKTNEKLSGSFLVIFCTVVALVIVTIALATLLTPAENAQKKKISESDITKQIEKIKEATETKEKETEAVKSESEESTDSTAPETESAVASELECFTPVAGYLIKGYDTELAVFSMTMNDYRTHEGIDVAADIGEPIYSFASGTVSAVYEDSFWGNCVEVEHENGMKSVYRSLSPEIAEGIDVGVAISAGQLLGTVGDTAKIESADSPHLHFELLQGGRTVNPLDYLAFEEMPASDETD